MFLLPLLLLRTRSWFDRLDVAMLLGFGVSYALFDTTHLEPGVWAFYPLLLYLMVRMLIRGFRARLLGRPASTAAYRPLVLALGLLALVVARIVITLHPAGVHRRRRRIGARRLPDPPRPEHLLHLARQPDTYGPINYLAYAPFELLWPGNWGYLPGGPGRDDHL